MAAAKFITFEGGEGAGKSTQVKLLAERLSELGVTPLLTREPGGSPFAENLRRLLLDPKTPPHDALAETLLFYAARSDHLDKTIRPALERGEWVICDRFSDSTFVYQSFAGGLPEEIPDILEQIVVRETEPDLTFILDIPAQLGLQRAAQRHQERGFGETASRDAYEVRDLEFHEALRQGFLGIAQAAPDRCLVIDATQDVEAVARDIWAAVAARLLPEATSGAAVEAADG